jgi:pimeloyl-ACP methyl ester carboxylesterase/DNA-binding CsgD family transcriptional regulator
MPLPAQQIRFCTSRDGTRIAYATCGTGPPLVWAAGWVHHLELDWDSPVWRPWLSVLARRHTLIRYDWRGCGLSDREQVDFSFERLVEDFEAVIEAAGLEQFVLFGIAAGSAVGMTYAVRHPERVSRLVLYAGYVRNKLAGNPTPQQVEEAQARLKMMELGWPNDTPAYGQFYTSLHMPAASAEQTQSFADLVRRTTSPANAVALLQAFFRIDVRETVPKIRCPTLVLHSRGDSIIWFEQGRSVAGLIPGARFVPLESGNHVLLETEPAWQQFVDALDDFLPAPAAKPAAGPPFLLGELTPREREVLELVAQGLDNGTIGARLGISERTARNHLSIILSKLGINSRAQAIVQARESGFGRSNSG